jgi:hypothetical protein
MSEPREGYEFMKEPTPEDVERAVSAIMKKYPFISESDARRLHVMRALGECSSIYRSSDGGGRTPKFLATLRSKYRREEIS